MNSIRPLISYSELLAAKQHAKIIRHDKNLTQQQKDFVIKIEDTIDKVFIQQASQIEFQIDINYPQL